jgi:CheY-like chemotaxis protein
MTDQDAGALRRAAQTRPLDVLIADDNRAGAEALATHLRACGHAVRVVGDGDGAIDAALAAPPDVALLDIGMPGRDGWEAAQTIRRVLAGRPCLLVAISGFTDEIDRRRSAEAGFDHHLAKPVSLPDLERLLAGQGHPLG